MKAGAVLSAAAALPSSLARAEFAPQPGTWRKFELSTRLNIANPAGLTQVWIPLPAFSAPGWFKPEGSSWKTNAKTAEISKDAKHDAEFLHIVWAEGESAPAIEVISTFTTQNTAVDLTKPLGATALSDAERGLNLASTELIPTDGIVKETSDKITAGATSDLEKTRLIYEWIVENCYRDSKTKGCGVGDVASLLKSGNLGDKCADINALFVGLARSAGLLARDLYGLRVAPSAFGYKSLGARTRSSPRPNTAAPRSSLPILVGFPSTQQTCARLLLRSLPGTCPSPTRRSRRPARHCSGSGRGTGLLTTAPTMSTFQAQWVPSSAF
jgi:hypothetical protein